MPENEEIHAYEFQKDLTFSRFPAYIFRKSPAETEIKVPNFGFRAFSIHKKLIFYSSTILKSNYQSACVFTI